MKIEKLPSRESRVNHGLGGTPTYRSWYTMIRRCTDPRDIGWPHYGGRGIEVCKRWFDLSCFVDDMGIRPQGMTIDRIDLEKGYEPSNCRWATITEQNRNRRTNVVNTKTAQAIREAAQSNRRQGDIAKAFNVSQSTVSRIASGKIWGTCAKQK
jgi:hypothetical protein